MVLVLVRTEILLVVIAQTLKFIVTSVEREGIKMGFLKFEKKIEYDKIEIRNLLTGAQITYLSGGVKLYIRDTKIRLNKDRVLTIEDIKGSLKISTGN